MKGYSINASDIEKFIASEDSKLYRILQLFIDSLYEIGSSNNNVMVPYSNLQHVKNRIEMWIDVSLDLRNNVFETYPYKFNYKNKELTIFIHSSNLDSLIAQVLDLYYVINDCIESKREIIIKEKEL